MHYRLPHPGQGILGPAPAIYSSQPTTLPSAFSIMSPQDPTWHMDTGASSHLNFNASNLSTIFYKRLFPSIHVGDGKSIPVTNTGHSIIPSHNRPLHLHNVLISLRCGQCRAISVQFPSMSTFYLLLFSRLGLPRGIKASDNPGDHGSQVAYLLIYVDDIILTTSCPTLIQQIIGSLNNEFDMTDLGVLNYFLGISADRTSTGLFLSQKKYALQLLEHAHMVTCNSSRTPINTESKLGPEGVPVQDPTLYRSLARGLQEPHFATLKCILRYVRGTVDFGLQLYVFATTSLVGYTDADWAGCPSTRRSTSGYYVFLGDNILSWSAKRQHTISCSSAEAEYQGVANVVAETAWIRNLLRELHSPLSTATLVYCDNVSAVYMSANPVQHQRMKHIEIDIHFVRDMVTVGHVRVLYVPSRFQYADIFTKGLPTSLFEDFRSSLSVRPPPAQTARAY
ncbi:ribonuclease H-like domain-containing protein [Tanacetum coccineum]